jgi:diguanylate cyclase (GGDEF)-like protein
MLDVDHFKAFNDNYGHQAGDDCLVNLANALQEQLQRPGDMLARYGGEEFMIILPNTDGDGAAALGEKLRQQIEDLAIEHAYSSTASAVTISVGAATVLPDANGTIEHLLREADIALYRAKQSGRNQVHSAPAIQKGPCRAVPSRT